MNLKNKILYPIEHHELGNLPIIFLAGPIKGAPMWQFQAIKYIRGKTSVPIASPRRPDLTEEECQKGGHYWGMYSKTDQALWEHNHLKHAGQFGVVMFWLPREVEHNPKRSYAQTSRFELGWMTGLHLFQNFRVVVGFEKGFSNEGYLRYTLTKEAPSIQLFGSLEETCAAAVTAVR